MPSGWIVPALPRACSTGFQSVAEGCWLFDCPDWFCGAEQATNAMRVATASPAKLKITRLGLRARDKRMSLSALIFMPTFLLVQTSSPHPCAGVLSCLMLASREALTRVSFFHGCRKHHGA